MEDKFGFTKDIQSYHNYRPLMFAAFNHTKGPILELGMGHGSTPILHQFSEDSNRHLSSWDSNQEWTSKFTHLDSPLHSIRCCNENWDDSRIELNPINEKWSVVLIDHAPGERRKVDILRFANKAETIVVHDTEPAADHGYRMLGALMSFRYRLDITSVGAWATVISNTLDVSIWKGKYPLHIIPGLQ